MITAEDRELVLRALRHDLISPDQVLVCIWDIEAHARSEAWDRTLPLRLVANGFLRQDDLLRLRAAVERDGRLVRAAGASAHGTPETGTGTPGTDLAVATPPAGLHPVPRAAAGPSGAESHPGAGASAPRPSPADHAAAAWLIQMRVVTPHDIRRAFQIQADYAPFGISLPLAAVLRRLGRLGDAPYACLRAIDFAAMAASTDWKSQAVPGWPILDRLATGGCATVFRARECFTGRTAALKILQRRLWTDPVSIARFETEGRLLTRLSHPSLVKGLACGVSPMGLPYTVLELVRGEPADQWIARRGPFPPAFALHVTHHVAEALAAIHAAGYVHCDVKPENILIGARQTVTLCDLHLAQPIGRAGFAPLERTAGTAAYMSPEQARGETDLGAATDLYALGLTLYALLTGRCPFEGKDPSEVLDRRFRGGTGAPDLEGLAAPQAVVALLRRMLQPDRQRRIGDAAEIRRAIAALRM